MKPKELKKLMSKTIGGFWSRDFLLMLNIVFITNYWFIETRNNYHLMNLLVVLIMLICAGYLAKMFDEGEKNI